MKAWWQWCYEAAHKAYTQSIQASIHDREAITPVEIMPAAWGQMNAWMRPKLLEAAPDHVKEWVVAKARQDLPDDSHVILFYIMKIFAPGGADERVQLNGAIQDPHCCYQPRAAQLELLK